MALSASNLTASGSGTNATSYTTASITPTANALLLCSVETDITGNVKPTLSGNGLTWIEVADCYYDQSATTYRVTLFRAMGASPSAGAVTIDFGATTVSGCGWVIDQITGTDTTGTNGSGAIVQSAKSVEPMVAGATSVTATLASGITSGNAAYTSASWEAAETGAADTGWTDLGTSTHSGPSAAIKTSWRNDNVDNAATTSWTTSALAGAIVLEIKVAGAAGGSTPTISETVVGSGTSVSSFTLTSWTPAANDLVIVWVAVRQSVAVSSISGNGLTFVNVSGATRQGTQSQERLECWRAQVASPSSGQITVTMASSALAVVAVAHRIAGANTGGTNGSTAVEVAASADTGASDTTTPSVDITTVSANSLVLGGCSHRNRTFTVGAGETAISINNAVGTSGDETRCSTEYQAVAAAATVTINGTLDSANDWTIGAIAIKSGGNSIALTTTISSASTTPTASALAVARALADTLSSASTTPTASVLALAIALVDSVASQSSTPDVVVLRLAIALADTVNSASTTNDLAELLTTFLRALTTTINSVSSTPDVAAVSVARGLADTLASQSSTPDVVVLLRAMGLADSVASQSSTPDVVALLRALPLSTTLNSSSSTPDVVALANLVSLATAILSASSTPDVAALAVARALATAISSASSTGDIDFEPLLAALLDHIFSVMRRRWLFVVGGRRTVAVPAARRAFEAHLMAVAEVPKDPDEVVDYSFDYAELLGADTIASSAWVADSGDVVVDADSETTTTTSVRLSAGTLNTKSKVKNTVVTVGGQTLIRRLVIVLQEM